MSNLTNAGAELRKAITGTRATVERLLLVAEWPLHIDCGPEGVEAALRRLDGVEYDAGFGSQELHGYVWLSDGTWLSRSEYDGAEEWVHHKRALMDANAVEAIPELEWVMPDFADSIPEE